MINDRIKGPSIPNVIFEFILLTGFVLFHDSSNMWLF